MLAWQILAASVPAIICVVCAAFLAYQQRPAWTWFIGLSIGAQFMGVLLVLQLRGVPLIRGEQLSGSGSARW